MKKVLSALFIPLCCLLGLSTQAQAHDPPDFIGAVWQWPETHLPVLDADLSEWDIIPEEFWITEQSVVQSTARPWIYTGDLDVSSISFRWIPTWNEETNRIYWAYERFDDKYQLGNESVETTVDADHSGRQLLGFGRPDRRGEGTPARSPCANQPLLVRQWPSS